MKAQATVRSGACPTVRGQVWLDHLRAAREQGWTLKAYAQAQGPSVSALATAEGNSTASPEFLCVKLLASRRTANRSRVESVAGSPVPDAGLEFLETHSDPHTMSIHLSVLRNAQENI